MSVHRLKVKRKRPMTTAQYNDLLAALETCVKERASRYEVDASKTLGLLKDVKFNACFNAIFRQESVAGLEELLDQLYVELNE